MDNSTFRDQFRDAKPQDQNRQFLLVHNVAVVRAESGWTKADVNQAIIDANNGVKYSALARYIAKGDK